MKHERACAGPVCGIDEAGRAPLAGPVTAACVHIPATVIKQKFWAKVRDSKQVPLALRSEIQMESSNGGPSAIPVKINGTDQKLTLATAGTTTQLNETAVKAMKLETQRSDLMLPDFRGMPQRVDEVTIADFAMPGLHGTNLKWPVSPGGGRGGRGGDSSDSGPAGLFSLNYMMVYDIDADFGSDKLRIFNQDHCPGAVMYWKAPGAVGVAPITIDNGRVTVPVTVNGKALTAVIDTAARDSRLYSAVADHVLGLDPTTTRKFDAAVAIGPLALSGVSINVIPDINAGAGAGDVRRVDPELGAE